jgi:hypothetical protein
VDAIEGRPHASLRRAFGDDAIDAEHGRSLLVWAPVAQSTLDKEVPLAADDVRAHTTS